jgi:hypothetical protein
MMDDFFIAQNSKVRVQLGLANELEKAVSHGGIQETGLSPSPVAKYYIDLYLSILRRYSKYGIRVLNMLLWPKCYTTHPDN